MKIIGIAGTNGSGKDTISQILAEHGWLFVSASADLIIPELKKSKLALERQQMAALTERWRQELGVGAVVDKAVDYFKNAPGQPKGLVISSLRHPGEAERVHQLGGQVIWVDAEPAVRYERIYSRGQGDKDQKTFEEFKAEEAAEMHSSGELYNQMAPIKEQADISIENSGSDYEAFRAEVLKTLKLKDD